MIGSLNLVIGQGGYDVIYCMALTRMSAAMNLNVATVAHTTIVTARISAPNTQVQSLPLHVHPALASSYLPQLLLTASHPGHNRIAPPFNGGSSIPLWTACFISTVQHTKSFAPCQDALSRASEARKTQGGLRPSLKKETSSSSK